MPTEFRSAAFVIPGGTGPKEVFGEVVFDAPVVSAETVIKSFSFDYTSDDHHINTVEALTNVISITGATVNVQVVCLFGDQNFDDPFTGLVHVLVLAQTGESG